MQLAGQRIALNLREASFNAQINSPNGQRPDLALRLIPLQAADPAAMLEEILRIENQPAAVEADPVMEYNAEREFLDRKTLIPLLHLPRAYALSPRVRDLELRADGSPDLTGASLEAAP